MSPKWMAFTLTSWVVLALLSGVLEGVYFAGGEAGVLNTLLNTPAIKDGNVVMLIFDWDFWGCVLKVFFFDFAMFTGVWVIARLILIAFFLGTLIQMILQIASHIPVIGRGR